MPTFEEIMKHQIDENPELIPVTQIPQEVTVKIKNYNVKVDAKGNECLFVTLLTKENERIIQKYTASSYREFFDAVNAAGGYDYLHEHFAVWSKSTFGQMKNARLLPMPKKAEPKAPKS